MFMNDALLQEQLNINFYILNVSRLTSLHFNKKLIFLKMVFRHVQTFSLFHINNTFENYMFSCNRYVIFCVNVAHGTRSVTNFLSETGPT